MVSLSDDLADFCRTLTLSRLLYSVVHAVVNTCQRSVRDSSCRNEPVFHCFHMSTQTVTHLVTLIHCFIHHLGGLVILQPMLFLASFSSMSFELCIHMCLRIPASMGSTRRQRPLSCQPELHKFPPWLTQAQAQKAIGVAFQAEAGHKPKPSRVRGVLTPSGCRRQQCVSRQQHHQPRGLQPVGETT